MLPDFKATGWFFLAILPLFVISCGIKHSPYEKITGTAKIGAFASLIRPFASLSSDVRIDISYLGKGIKGKGYLYYREGNLRILLLNPLKSPLYDLMVDSRSSYLIDYQYMGYLDLKDEKCIDREMLPEKFNTVLPMLFLDISGENLKLVRSLYRDEEGRLTGVDYLSREMSRDRLVSLQYLDYQDVNGTAVPGKIAITNAGNDIVIELTGNIHVDEPIKDTVFDLARLNNLKDLCSEE